MRTFIAVMLALVAIAAASLWGLAQFSEKPAVMTAEQRPPVSKVEAAAGGASAPLVAPAAAPEAAHPNDASTLKTDKPAAQPPTQTAKAEPQPAPPVATAQAAPAPAPTAPALAEKSAAPAPGAAAVALPSPPPPASSDLVQAASAPAAAPAPTTAPPASLSEEFKTRKVAYNRPPATLYLDRPIDISLVIDATAAADPASHLQGFPGTVVSRDVALSDTVSAQLTGVGFDIAPQSVERQVLSGKVANRWQWRVTPTEPGTRILMLDIFGYKTGSLDAEPLDAYRDQITVQVKQLDTVVKLAKTYQPVLGIVGVFTGAISALLAFLRHRRETKKKVG